MEKNYYLILGVSSTATLEEIKSAFRRRAMELHPDHSGRESGPFLEIQEAYGVLSDPERRRSYDRRSHSIVARRAPWRPSPEPLVSRRFKIEPLKRTGRGYDAREFLSSEPFGICRPSSGELFERLWSNFENRARPKADRIENLTLEAVLNPEEAAQGGTIRLRIPGLATCPTCGGHGAIGPYECWRCQGNGAMEANYPVEIQFPAGVRDGYSVRVALSRFGIENLYLAVRFRVSEKEA